MSTEELRHIRQSLRDISTTLVMMLVALVCIGIGTCSGK
jgi:hypothetical protein